MTNDKYITVLFVYPNERHMSTVPPAIAILSRLLKDAGHRVDVFDTTFYEFEDEIAQTDADQKMESSLNVRPIKDIDDDDLHFVKKTESPIDDLRKQIVSVRPDLLAVSCTETTFPRGVRLIRETKDLGVPCIFGGVFPTFAPQLVMNEDVVDMLCVGEGENAIVELADAIATGQDYGDIPNLWVRDSKGGIIKNKISNAVDINQLPVVTDIGIFGEKRFYRPMGGKIRRLLPVETHRGCPYTCSFCNSPSQNVLYRDNNPFFRKKSIKLVRDEIENHVREWGVEYIYFWADTFLAWSNKEFDEFCEMYQDIRLPFWCQTRIETISEKKLAKLKDVGLDRMTFGMEHGNEEFRRRVVKRDYTNEAAIRLMQIPSALDITYSVNNIIGFPTETRELAFDTIEINRAFKADSLSCSTLVPFHGTEIRRMAEKLGLIDKNAICSVSNSADESVLDMPQWPKEDIARLRRTFVLYVKLPKSRWPEVKLAETDDEVFDRLAAEYIEQEWGGDPHGKIDSDLAEAMKGLT